MSGFSPIWCKWIEDNVSGGSVSIKINDDTGGYFRQIKGSVKVILYHQSCLILSRICLRLLLNGQKWMVKLLGLCRILWMMAYPFYSMRMTQLYLWIMILKRPKNLKLHLYAFWGALRLEINFHKSELFCFGEAQTNEVEYAVIFGCEQAMCPIRYLGIPNGDKWKKAFRKG